jgi:hypothetical protein
MAPVQSLHYWWFVIPDCTPGHIENIYSVLSNDATRKSTRPYREPNEKNGIRYAVTGLYFSKWKDSYITIMTVSKKLEELKEIQI